jgi:phosphohistidine phosphatase
MRHAKSAWPNGVSDHERPLDAKGISDTPKIAQKIKSLGYEPELILCSDSQRTLETCSLLVSTLGEQLPLKESARLYNSDVKSYLETLADQNFKGHTLLLIGHNPTIEELIFVLAGNTKEMKPANVAVLEIHSDNWKNALLQRGVWKLVNLITC